MKIITGPRVSGKTTEAVELANEKDARLVVATQKRKDIVSEVCDNEPLTYEELRSGSHLGRKPNKLVIDNADHLLSTIVDGFKIEGVAMTSTEVQILNNEFAEE